MNTTADTTLTPTTGPLANPAIRRLVSVLLGIHVLAVLIAPLMLEAQSQLVSYPRRAFQPYLAATYLNNGYRFFAPDPGTESHLVFYKLKMPDGSMVEGKFPNLNIHRPRLLYHRHFMLAEFLNSSSEFQYASFVEPPPRDMPSDLLPAFEEGRARFQAICRSYAHHLLATTGAVEVSLYRERHLIPTLPEVAAGRKLDDPNSYRDELLGVYPQDGR